MAEFVLSIADADVERVTAALCSPFNFSYYSHGLTMDEVPGADAAKARVIAILKAITVQVETEAAQAAIVPSDMS